MKFEWRDFGKIYFHDYLNLNCICAWLWKFKEFVCCENVKISFLWVGWIFLSNSKYFNTNLLVSFRDFVRQISTRQTFMSLWGLNNGCDENKYLVELLVGSRNISGRLFNTAQLEGSAGIFTVKWQIASDKETGITTLKCT